MKTLLYVILNDGWRERVDRDEIDAVEQAGVIDRSLLPIVAGEAGYARNKEYVVKGEISGKRAILRLQNHGVDVASVYMCLHSRSSKSLYEQVIAESGGFYETDVAPPPSPWIILRYDIPEFELPEWIDWWVKNVGWALIQREGW